METLLKQILRWPVKGLSPDCLSSTHFETGQAIKADRKYALAPGSSTARGQVNEWMSKNHFLMLARHEKLLSLETTFDEKTNTLTVLRGDRQVAKGVLSTPVGRSIIETFFTSFMGDKAQGQIRVVEAAPGHTLSDHNNPVVSLINLTTIKDLERVIGKPVDPIRFRGNLYFQGAKPWMEFDWVGREINIGACRLFVTERIDRCAATNVNPDTAKRDMNIPKSLQHGFGHIDVGVYAKVITSGEINVGDTITPADGVL